MVHNVIDLEETPLDKPVIYKIGALVNGGVLGLRGVPRVPCK